MSCTLTKHDPKYVVTRTWDTGKMVKMCTKCECTVNDPVKVFVPEKFTANKVLFERDRTPVYSRPPKRTNDANNT